MSIENWKSNWIDLESSWSSMGEAIKFFANNLGLGFGIGIIIVTLIVRLIILPLGLYQSWKATYQSEKMNYLKPILGPIKRHENASTQEEKLLAQQEWLLNVKMRLCLGSWVLATFYPNAILLCSLLCSSTHQKGSR